MSSCYYICATELQQSCNRAATELLLLPKRVLILIYMCPHTPIYVSSSSYIRVLILLYTCPHTPNTYTTCLGVTARRREAWWRVLRLPLEPPSHTSRRAVANSRGGLGGLQRLRLRKVWGWVWVCGCEQRESALILLWVSVAALLQLCCSSVAARVCLDTAVGVYAYEYCMCVRILLCVSACYCMYMCWLRLCKLKAACTSCLRPHALVA